MMAMHLIPGLAAALVAVTLLAAPEDAQALQPATGKVILTMTGKVGDANKANAAECQQEQCRLQTREQHGG